MALGRGLNWQAATGYGKRALIETTTMGRYKALIGPRLRARCFTAKQTEVAIGCAVVNRMLETGHRIPSAAKTDSHKQTASKIELRLLPYPRTNAS